MPTVSPPNENRRPGSAGDSRGTQELCRRAIMCSVLCAALFGTAHVDRPWAQPLSSSPLWTAESNQLSAEYGATVSTAGDVNGDGYDDVIIGAHLFNNGQTDEGRVFVYYSSAAGPSLTPSWTSEGNQNSADYGNWVANAGDVNADGYDDVIIGADLINAPLENEGRAYVYMGSPTGSRPGRPGSWTATSPTRSWVAAFLGPAM